MLSFLSCFVMRTYRCSHRSGKWCVCRYLYRIKISCILLLSPIVAIEDGCSDAVRRGWSNFDMGERMHFKCQLSKHVRLIFFTSCCQRCFRRSRRGLFSMPSGYYRWCVIETQGRWAAVSAFVRTITGGIKFIARFWKRQILWAKYNLFYDTVRALDRLCVQSRCARAWTIG